jgi:hypothetical protein
MINQVSLFALALCLLFSFSKTARASPFDTSFEGSLITPDDVAGATLIFSESTQQASLELTGLQYWPDELDSPAFLPPLTLTGPFTYNPAQNTFSIELEWNGDLLALNENKLHVKQGQCRTTGNGLTFFPASNSLNGPVQLAAIFFYEGFGEKIEPFDSGYTLDLNAPNPNPTPTPIPNPEYADSTIVFSNLNSTHWEHSEGFPPFLQAPIFDEEFGLALYVSDPNATFGYWQTRKQLNSLPAGRYSLIIHLLADPTNIDGRYPEMRIRVFQGDNSLSKMSVFAQVTPETETPSYIEVVWQSDGVSPWRVAIDLLSFVPDYEGGYSVFSVTNNRI